MPPETKEIFKLRADVDAWAITVATIHAAIEGLPWWAWKRRKGYTEAAKHANANFLRLRAEYRNQTRRDLDGSRWPPASPW